MDYLSIIQDHKDVKCSTIGLLILIDTMHEKQEALESYLSTTMKELCEVCGMHFNTVAIALVLLHDIKAIDLKMKDDNNKFTATNVRSLVKTRNHSKPIRINI